jgi:glycogen synthase
MPKDMEFMDIRKGSDVEFGQSTYEPFGIAQLESLTFGGICVISSVCGCAGFVRDVAGGENGKNVIIADYTNINHHSYDDIEDLLQIDQAVRDRIEIRQSQKVAKKIVSQLKNSQSDTESMIQTGYELAQNMSWEMVVKNYLFNSLQKALQKQHAQSVYTKK